MTIFYKDSFGFDDVAGKDQTLLEQHGLVFDGDHEVSLPTNVIEVGQDGDNTCSITIFEVDGIRFETVDDLLTGERTLRVVRKEL